MSFLNPILLAGVAAIAVPIIIHLLNRRRFQKVRWAAMRFLQNAIEQNQRRLRIEDLILLALRCLLLALLALALARPAVLSNASGVFGQSKVIGAIILDNSLSMGMSDGTATRFDKARAAALQILDSLPAGSAVAVLLASDTVRAAIPEPTYDLNLARKILREAPLSDRATDLLPALNQAVRTLEDRLAVRKEIFLLTDGQAAGWRQLSEIQSLLERSKTAIASHVVLINEHEARNLSLSDLRMASGLSPIRQPLRFEARVTNHGQEEVRQARISLAIDGDPPHDEFTLETIPGGASRNVTLFANFRTEGFHTVTARLVPDRLPADDERTVALRAIREVKVLLVDGDPGNEPRESEVFFLRHALAPVAPDAAADYFIQVKVITSAELAQTRWTDFDAAILANVPTLPESAVADLAPYLRSGGGLIVFPGDRIDAAFYNDQLLRQHRFLPAALGTPRGQSDQEGTFTTFQAQGYEHPVVSLWNDPASGTLASARFFKHIQLRPDPPPASPPGAVPQPSSVTPPPSDMAEAGIPQVILAYKDGTPAVMERTWGLGRVVLFSSTADTAWNDLPVRPAFVPLLHRTLGAIVLRQDEGLNLRVGDKFRWRLGPEFLGRDATFLMPRQVEVMRDLRPIDLVAGQPLLQYDQTDRAGVYEVAITDPTFKLKFAAQADPRESSLEELSPAQLAPLRHTANVVSWTPDLSLRTLMQKGRSGLELWVPVAVICLLVALLEIALGQWFSRSR
ncbi:MAG TPA: BatA domain-containing protein [Methylomirabilota bacterium]|nr:BatA domain-containing protein [Methylomirabilota bacterium]